MDTAPTPPTLKPPTSVHSLRRGSYVLGLALALATATLVAPAPAQARAGYPASVVAAATYPRYGERSSAVWALQKKLVEAGLLRADLRTGHFGPYPLGAVKTVQRRYHLPVTGRVDAATMTALDRAVQAMTGPRTWWTKQVMGTSTEGRPIVAYRAGQPGKPVVAVVATMHGEEDFGQYVVHGLMEGRPIKSVDLWLVPVLNPDGLAKTRRWVSTQPQPARCSG